MASQNQVLYEKDNVFIHINVSNAKDKDAHISGRVFLITKADGTYLEWRAEDTTPSEQSDQDWAVITSGVSSSSTNSVTYRNDRDPDTASMNSKMDARRKYNISFDVLDLKSFKRNAPNHGWAYIIFILKDGTTFPALHFHTGGSKALLKDLEKFVHIRRSPNDSRLFIVQEHDPEMLSKSFDELNLFADTSRDLVSKFIKDPYVTTMGSFSKVTNYLRDVLLQDTNPTMRPRDELAELLQEDIPGMEISHQDEPGFEVITKTKLPPRPEVTRGDPLNSSQWTSMLDSEGRIKDVDRVKDIIFRGGVESTLRSEVWKFLLDYYSWDSTYKTRQELRKRKVDDYFRMKLQWKTISADQERRFAMLRERKGLIDKDVTRTDRTQSFFTGDNNQNLQVLNDVLITYCMYNFDLGYVQGMSDLLSPILVVMENEVDSFWCFAGIMERLCGNFEMDQNGMKVQLAQIHKLMQVYDPELCNYLESHDSGNFYFCFRWILIMFKREFHFHEIQRLWEIVWTDRPCKNFHLVISLAILDSEKSTLMESSFGFTEILKHINDISLSIPLEDTLKKAEGIFLQLKTYKKLPVTVKEILGLTSSPQSSMSGSSQTTPSTTPLFGDSHPQLDLPLLTNDHSACSSGKGSMVTTPDDSSIEILTETGEATFVH
ncbi:TBC1 domain family member 15-like isoform X2 [Gigantopelta aegis]|uniref:TBC1 domain family member 15-like isoform X2 n=1 Tax=Gigantopelta aegis TaxID=1735272 RepID=UPI001B8892AA|nr:TBC1 domain family member 15-like isoform X2 [Gigantopelta aegis]